jgi:protein-tyrosine phosphatase
MIRVLFVCVANSQRSPAAEAILKHLVSNAGLTDLIEVDSAGLHTWKTGQMPDPMMRLYALKRGYALISLSRKVAPEDYSTFDWILGMSGEMVEVLEASAPKNKPHGEIRNITEYKRELSFNCVPDPCSTDMLDLVLDILEDSCKGFFEHLSTNLPKG